MAFLPLTSGLWGGERRWSMDVSFFFFPQKSGNFDGSIDHKGVAFSLKKKNKLRNTKFLGCYAWRVLNGKILFLLIVNLASVEERGGVLGWEACGMKYSFR
jgi:hypothetical protein